MKYLLFSTVLGLSGSAAFAAPPNITSQPVSAVVGLGQAASLSVSAGGSGPLAYQWLRDGVILCGETNSTLSFTSFQFTNSGSYYAVVTNSTGLAISLPASLSVSNAPLRVWGYNYKGQLGNGTTASTNRPLWVAGNVTAAAAGLYHSLYVTADGTLWAMGYNAYGQLGNGTTTDQHSPIAAAGNVVAEAAGGYHSLYVTGDGALWAMGDNGNGQLGNGTTANTNLPVAVASNVVAVAAGFGHSLYVTAGGALWAMGYNGYGQLGNGTATDQYSPVAVASNVVAVAAGEYHSLYVTADGRLWAMGWNNYGQLGNGTLGNANLPIAVASNVVAAAAGYGHSIYVTADGALWSMGWNAYGQLGNVAGNASRPVAVVSNVVAAVAGENYTLFATADGSLWAMGADNAGQLGNGTTVTTANKVPVLVNGGGLVTASLAKAGTAEHALAIAGAAPAVDALANQMIYAGQSASFTATLSGGDGPFSYQWLFNGTELVGATNATYTIASAVASNTGNYAVIVTGPYASTTSGAATLTVINITAQPASAVVGLGQATSLSVTYGGPAPFGYQWLKDGVMLPGQTNGTLNFACFQLTNSGSYSVAITNSTGLAISLPASLSISNAPLRVWGYNNYGQLGNGTTGGYSNRPAAMASNVVAAATGYEYSLCVTAGGTLWAMGHNGAGELGNGAATNPNRSIAVASNVVTVAAGYEHSLFVKADGTLWAMGGNTCGQLGNGTTGGHSNWPVAVASGVVAVAAGYYHSLYVTADGTLWAMGFNAAGQLGNGTTVAYTNVPVLVNGGGLVAASLAKGCEADHALAVAAAPPVVNALIHQMVYAGQSASFTASVSGWDSPLTYHWLFNGTNLVGATNATYTIASAAASDSGSYAVIVTGLGGSTTSGAATLNVINITAQPVSAVVGFGQAASLSVTYGSPAPFGYQWLKDGAVLPGQTNSTLSFASFQFANSGSYYVAITNSTGLAVSLPASLSVSNAPLRVWGYNNYGQLGNGTTANTNLPVAVAGNVVAAAAGYEHSLYVTADGMLWAMGYNAYGQLGNGTTNDQYSPVAVASNVVAAAAGYGHSLYVTAGGTLWAMGYNGEGELGNGTTANTNLPVAVASNVVAVAAGDRHSLFVKGDGTLWATGDD